VTEFASGASAGGVLQLIGNVWEWTASPFQLWIDDTPAEFDEAYQSVRGGAYDTYFELHADCQAQSGESPLGRKHNIGFRCAVSACDLVFEPTAPQAAAADAALPEDEVDHERVA
jgi:iron(II)-dependent oxidoreductase